ncbi:MAG: TonB-dependent receptor [Paludibacteraceae bacterium]|nr:TonB-dependent receptor [Paludibacteraceae bacterium]
MVGSAKAHPFFLNAQHTGERTSSDIYDIMPAYLLWNLYGEFRIPLRKKKCTTCDQEIILNGQINNLFDTDYQNIPYRAMPGRNFSIGAQWKLGLKK